MKPIKMYTDPQTTRSNNLEKFEENRSNFSYQVYEKMPITLVKILKTERLRKNLVKDILKLSLDVWKDDGIP